MAVGIGSAIATELARKGCNVVINYNKSEDKAVQLKQELLNEGLNIEIFRADVSKVADVDELVAFAISRYNNIDILVNNAGINKWGTILDLSEQDWDNIINVNLKSMFLVTKKVIPYMINKKNGHIINISSIWGSIGSSCEVAYSASKAGVIGFTKAVAKELAPSNIKVNSIAPGYIETDMNSFSYEEINNIKSDIPLNRIGKVQDVAQCTSWLIDSEYITGQVIGIDGGWNM